MTILVTASTRHGSTTAIAAAIARTLEERGLDVDEIPPSSVHGLQEYDGVVLGSAVYAGRWLRPATAVAKRCAEQTDGRPVWLFSSGPTGTSSRPEDLPDVSDLVRRTGARDHQVFAGKLDVAGLGPVERVMVRAVHSSSGDFRDWDAVHLWATGIADALLAPRPPAVAPGA